MGTEKIFSLLVLSYFWLAVEAQNHALYINYLNCTVSDKFIFPNWTCYAKSYNRSFSGLNIIGTSRVPLNNVTVSLK